MAEQAEREELSLYKGSVDVRFYPKSHKYYIQRPDIKGFKPKKGVTTILGIKDKSKPLGIWQQHITADFLLNKIAEGKKINEDLALEAVIQCDLFLKQAADIGHEIHEWIELYIRNKLKQPGFESIPDMPKFPEAVEGINAFFEWEKKHKVKFLETEKIVYSLEHDYIGILDFAAVIDGVTCAGDFKSSSGLYNSVRAQTAAYAMADMEENKIKYKGRWAVRLSKISEKDHYAKEERKRELKRAIAKVKGIPFKDFNNKEYKIFEAKFLDDQKSYMKRDFDAFLLHKALGEWDKETDPYIQGENW